MCCDMLPCTLRDFCESEVDQCVVSGSAWADNRISCSVQLTTGESRLAFSLRNGFPDGFCYFVLVEKKTVCGLYWFAGHCNQVDVIPVWSDPGEYIIALGDFVALCSIRRWVSWTLLVWSFAGHGDQHGCAYVLSG